HRPGGIGGVIRNHNGDWKVSFVSRESHVDPILAEVRALRQGLLMAMEYNLMPLDINTNSLQIFREQNQVADMHSKEGLNFTTFCQPTFWTTPLTPTLFVKKLVWVDILGTIYPRKLNPLTM
ncbi:hypothetical protein MTR67_007110, partial [Solanum verrucosum]